MCFILCLDVGRYKFDNLVCLTCGVFLFFSIVVHIEVIFDQHFCDKDTLTCFCVEFLVNENQTWITFSCYKIQATPAMLTSQISILSLMGERGGSVVECRTLEREVRGSRPTSAVLCP